MKLAAQANPAVVVSRAQSLAAHGDATAAKAKEGPRLSLNGFAGSGTYGAIYSSSVDPSYSLLTPSGTFVDGNLMLAVPLFTDGRLSAATRSARRLEDAASQDLRETQADAAFRSAEAYLSVLVAKASVDAADARIQAARELVRTMQVQLDAGSGIEASVQRAKAELAQAQRMKTVAEGQRDKALLDLKAESGLDPDSDVSLVDYLDGDITVDDVATSLKSATTNRGQVLMAKARFEAATADLNATRGASGPQVYAEAMADSANDSVNRGASIGLTVSIPLFDGGARQAETSKARATRDAAAANVRLAEITTQKEVRQAYVDLHTAVANVASAEESLRSAKESYDIAAMRVSSGKGILVEQLDATQVLTQARLDLAISFFDRRLAALRILKACGTIVSQEAKK